MRRPAELLLRFTRAERWVHRSTAVLMGCCLLTAAILYIGPLSVLVGRRAVVVWVHVLAGLALPVPVLLGWASAAFRVDAGRLNRFDRADWEWLRSADRRTGRIPIGKFNPGQKLYAAFVAGAIAVQFGTGVLMRYGQHWPLSLRTGATFVHDWLAAAVAVAVLGHLHLALRDRDARAGMRTGWVPADWARREHPRWAAETDAAEPEAAETAAAEPGAAGPTAAGGQPPSATSASRST
jgi:formate dehydrogenase subunit gamma